MEGFIKKKRKINKSEQVCNQELKICQAFWIAVKIPGVENESEAVHHIYVS